MSALCALEGVGSVLGRFWRPDSAQGEASPYYDLAYKSSDRSN